jgi:hypothetical protein
VSHIIRAATHVPHVLEECGKTLLARGPTVVMRARSKARSMVRVMSSLGATLGPRSRSDHPGNLLVCATKRHSVGLHLNDLPTNHTSRSPDFNQTLNILAIVRSYMLHGGPLDFLKDEVTAMNLPEALGLAVEQQKFFW